MTGLGLDHFIHAAEDFEGAQYRILGELQQARKAFSRNVIYPHLGELINVYGALHTIIRQLEAIREALPGSITGLDPNSYQIIYEKPPLGPNQMGQVEDLIRWAMPYLQSAIEEGRTIFEFVEENLHMEEVGILPSYVEEGYLMLPNCLDQQLHVFQYTLSVFTHIEERFRSLKTTYVKSIAQRGVYPSPQSIKLELVAENRALPNPATYFFSTDLDFPFEPTVLPVAKRKLMQYLATQDGIA